MARAARGMLDSGSRSGTSPSSSASSPQRGRWQCAEAGTRVQKAFVIVHKRTVRGAGSSCVHPRLVATGPGSRLKLCSSREGLALCVMG